MISTTLPSGSQGKIRIWNRELTTYPERGARRMYLLLVMLITVTLYYELYVGSGVATIMLAQLKMPFPDIRLHTCGGKFARGLRIAAGGAR